jgi:peptidyl-tRNA hydrolase, PTH1 family
VKLIVGLGNPELRYEYTRHNLGFLVLAALAERNSLKYKKSPVAQAVETKLVVEGQHCSLMMPLTYMNNSGIAVRAWIDKKGITPADILVVCDELAFKFTEMRLRPNGTAGGHNGLKSIIEHLGTKDFARLRLGIGPVPANVDTADYVLSNFTAGEKKLLPGVIEEAVACVTSWVTQGTQATMNQFNGSTRPD